MAHVKLVVNGKVVFAGELDNFGLAGVCEYFATSLNEASDESALDTVVNQIADQAIHQVGMVLRGAPEYMKTVVSGVDLSLLSGVDHRLVADKIIAEMRARLPTRTVSGTEIRRGSNGLYSVSIHF